MSSYLIVSAISAYVGGVLATMPLSHLVGGIKDWSFWRGAASTLAWPVMAASYFVRVYRESRASQS